MTRTKQPQPPMKPSKGWGLVNKTGHLVWFTNGAAIEKTKAGAEDFFEVLSCPGERIVRVKISEDES